MAERDRQIITTGRPGFVGSRIAQLIPHRLSPVDLDITTGQDITDPDVVNRTITGAKGDTVLHLAALADVGKAETQRGDMEGSFMVVNAIGTRNVANACAYAGKRMLLVSTDYVFRGDRPGRYTEASRRSNVTLGWYAETKRRAEEIVEEVAMERGLEYTIMRIAFPYRARFDAKSDIVRRMQTGLRDGTLPPQFTDHIITPTFIDDIAHVVDETARNRPSGIIHVVGSTSLSPYELAREVAEASGMNPDSVRQSSLVDYLRDNPQHRSRYPQYLEVGNDRVTQELGIHMSTVKEGVAELVRQQRRHR